MFDFLSKQQKFELIKNTLLKIYVREDGVDSPLHRKLVDLSTKMALRRFSSEYKAMNFFAKQEIEREQTIERD